MTIKVAELHNVAMRIAPGPDAATLPLRDIVRAIEIAIRTTLATAGDSAVSAGTLH